MHLQTLVCLVVIAFLAPAFSAPIKSFEDEKSFWEDEVELMFEDVKDNDPTSAPQTATVHPTGHTHSTGEWREQEGTGSWTGGWGTQRPGTKGREGGHGHESTGGWGTGAWTGGWGTRPWTGAWGTQRPETEGHEGHGHGASTGGWGTGPWTGGWGTGPWTGAEGIQGQDFEGDEGKGTDTKYCTVYYDGSVKGMRDCKTDAPKYGDDSCHIKGSQLSKQDYCGPIKGDKKDHVEIMVTIKMTVGKMGEMIEKIKKYFF